MSGHSKWSTIKRKKGAADQKRGKQFTRCIHEITVAVREGGGGNSEGNSRLRLAIDKAKANNMPNDTIERAIRRATGEEKGEDKSEVTYEGYGPGGTAFLVETVTSNKNRTVGEVRHSFTRCGGSLGETGCVNWMFHQKGLLIFPKGNISEEELMEKALEVGAEDIVDSGDMWEITCPPNMFTTVYDALLPLVEPKGKFEVAEIQMIPSNRIEVAGKEAEQVLRLIEMLEELDDVVNVYSNCDLPEDIE